MDCHLPDTFFTRNNLRYYKRQAPCPGWYTVYLSPVSCALLLEVPHLSRTLSHKMWILCFQVTGEWRQKGVWQLQRSTLMIHCSTLASFHASQYCWGTLPPASMQLLSLRIYDPSSSWGLSVVSTHRHTLLWAWSYGVADVSVGPSRKEPL